MTTTTSRRTFRLVLASCVSLFVLMMGSTYAWANEATVEGQDATSNVPIVKTNMQWFNWPGWFFLALTILVLAVVGFAWYKSVLEPKCRGRKVAQ